MNLFDIPVSAIRAAQTGMTVVSSNLTNATTPGYHRQNVVLNETMGVTIGNHQVGVGVEASSIQRLRSVWVERSMLRNNSALGEANIKGDVASQLDTLFQLTDGNLSSRVQEFFNSWQDISAQPTDNTYRTDLLSTATTLTAEISQIYNQMGELEIDLDSQIIDTVNTINSLTSNIATLNRDIMLAEAAGRQPNDLLDRRDLLVTELSGYIDVSAYESTGQRHMFTAGNGSMLITTTAPILEVVQTNGKYELVLNGWTSPLPAGGGKLAGLIDARTSIVGQTRAALGDWSTSLVRSVDQLHAQGLGMDGPLQSLNGERGVTDSALPLAVSSVMFPVGTGNLTITMTNRSNGLRTSYVIPVEPAVDSLNDIAARLNAIPNLTAAVSATTGRLNLAADTGFGFDFTAEPPTRPDMTAWTGTSDVTIGGAYTGSGNQNWTIKVNGPGTIGVTPGLRGQVYDGGGNLIGDFNIGLGYVGGDSLLTTQGITVSFGSGTVAGADTAGLRVVSNPDEPGLLSALGLNTLFTGTTPGSFKVRQSVLDDPSLVAASKSTRMGDNSNATAIAATARQLLAGNGRMTFSAALAQMSADVGSLVQTVGRQQDQLSSIDLDLKQQQQAVSGVDPNEELVRMLEYQRMFQSASRYITTINSVLDDLFSMAR